MSLVTSTFTFASADQILSIVSSLIAQSPKIFVAAGRIVKTTWKLNTFVSLRDISGYSLMTAPTDGTQSDTRNWGLAHGAFYDQIVLKPICLGLGNHRLYAALRR